jgi:membrane associated rhomboid family serine protease
MALGRRLERALRLQSATPSSGRAVRLSHQGPISLRDASRPPAPLVTMAIIGVNLIVFWYEVTLNDTRLDRFLEAWGVVPHMLVSSLVASQVHPGLFVTPLTSMFLHVHGLHLATNMLYLAVFGASVEQLLGRRRFLLFYATCGLLAVGVQVVTAPASLNPAVGASGAIAGLLAASLVLRPSSIIGAVAPGLFYFPRVDFTAAVMLGLWLLSQLFGALLGFNSAASSGPGAWVAHLAGFVAGFGLVFAFRPRRRRPYYL